VNEHTERL
jgi:transposase